MGHENSGCKIRIGKHLVNKGGSFKPPATPDRHRDFRIACNTKNQRITPLFDFWENFWYNFYVKVIRGSFLYSKIKMRDSICGCPFLCMLLSPSRVHLYSCAIGFELCQRGKVVIIFRQVRVEDCTIMFRHGKGAMPQEFLQSKGIAATINQILSGKGVAEQVDACLLDTAPRVIPCYGLPQTILREL